MRSIAVHIQTENAAFQPNPATEVGQLLHSMANDIEHEGIVERNLLDADQNIVGRLVIDGPDVDAALDGLAEIERMAESVVENGRPFTTNTREGARRALAEQFREAARAAIAVAVGKETCRR